MPTKQDFLKAQKGNEDRFDNLDGKVDSLKQDFLKAQKGNEDRFNNLDGKVDSLKQDFLKAQKGNEDRFGILEGKVDKLEVKVESFRQEFQNAQKENQKKFGGINARFDENDKNFADLIAMLDKRFSEVEDGILSIKNLLYRHLEVDDDKFWEIKHRHQVYDFWFSQIADKINLPLTIPEKLKNKQV